MFDFFKKKKTGAGAETPETPDTPTPEEKPVAATPSWTERLKQGLTRSRENINEGLSTLFFGKRKIDEAVLEELEILLLSADMGSDITARILSQLKEQVKRSELNDSEALKNTLQKLLFECLQPYAQPLVLPSTQVPNKPYVILVVGVNGVGKTTSIGKLAHYYQSLGKSVLLAAGDTFRAAAVEQLKIWGERNDVPVVAQHPGADSAAVIFDALSSATAKNIDVMIADTAGRLHTKAHLMEELKKVLRVLRKIDETAPHEILLILDATLGQNSIQQAQVFHQSLSLTGLALTKLDGTAKGGVIFNLADALKLPIRFIGVGESIDDLRPFDAETFVKALLTS